eukprot:TRINITY_DN100672_c0_g1_i1.p1 TRINITY_DN100672_c0_g1~~TRINITY_DN100672_c0_g1_i1.p1  ORF type:complete len:663 (-),score=169.48 TRINITY_DN100672_c0_g1_i1:89-2077(-)
MAAAAHRSRTDLGQQVGGCRWQRACQWQLEATPLDAAAAMRSSRRLSSVPSSAFSAQRGWRRLRRLMMPSLLVAAVLAKAVCLGSFVAPLQRSGNHLRGAAGISSHAATRLHAIPDWMESFFGLAEADASEWFAVEDSLTPLLIPYLSLGESSAVLAAARQRWERLSEDERPLVQVVLRKLAGSRAPAKDLVAAVLSVGTSLPVLGGGSGQTRKEVEAKFGSQVAWLTVELQQFATIERTLMLTARPAAAVALEQGSYADTGVLTQGQVDLGLSLLTAQRAQTSKYESLILFLTHKAAHLRLQASLLETSSSSREDEVEIAEAKIDAVASASMAMDIFAPLANVLGLVKVKDELEDASFSVLHREARLKLLENPALSLGAKEAFLRSALFELQMALLPDFQCQAIGLGLKCTATSAYSTRLPGVVGLTVEARGKSLYSTWKKARGKHLKPEDIFDHAAMRIILDADDGKAGEDSCYAARDVVHSLWPVIEEREKDYISRPKASGYQSLHLVAQRDDSSYPSRGFEVQIRTRQMHRDAELGPAAHFRYKAGDNVEPTDAAKEAAGDILASIDADGDGTIDARELREALSTIGVITESSDAERMMEWLDADLDGKIGFTDFWKALVTTWFPLVSGTHNPWRRPPDAKKTISDTSESEKAEGQLQ